MSIETAVTRAWQRQAAWLWLLLPMSWLYGLISLLRCQAYRLGLLSSYRAPIAVMVIGNITVGGSGKTPLIISLVSYLQQRGIKVGVISRGYGGDTRQMPALVASDSLPSIVGDEPCLIVNMTSAPMAVCPDREQAITTLLQAHPDLQLIIADDGLQHYALKRDIEWIVVDVARGFGNRQLLPTGFLREPISRLKDSTVIYHQKPKPFSPHDKDSAQHKQHHVTVDCLDADGALTMQLQPDDLQPLLFRSNNAALNKQTDTLGKNKSKPVKGSQVHAVSGIGYPQRFFSTLATLGFEVIEHPYPDHHDFKLSELLQYTDYPIVITSKDAVKIRALFKQEGSQASLAESQNLLNNIWVLPVTAVLSETCYITLERQLVALDIVEPR